MGLAFDLLLTLLIELPVIALFFKRKKRPGVLMIGLLVNLVSWSVVHILKISTDININIIEIIVVTGEGIALWLLTTCGWKKGLMISVLANVLSFFIIKMIHFDPEIFQSKPNIIIH